MVAGSLNRRAKKFVDREIDAVRIVRVGKRFARGVVDIMPPAEGGITPVHVAPLAPPKMREMRLARE